MGRGEERPVVIPHPEDASRALEGLYIDAGGETGAVIAPPHPLYGGSMDSPVVSELAHACLAAGISSLRFNWRGVGASAGEPSGELDDARADYAAALAQLGDSVSGELLACGYSFGGVTALSAGAAEARVRRLLLVAPPAPMLDVAALEAFSGPVLLLAGERDELARSDTLAALCAELESGRFVLLDDADHFFSTGLGALSREARKWLG